VTDSDGLSGEALLNFCHAHGIGTVYLFAEAIVQEVAAGDLTGDGASWPAFRVLVKRLRAGGVGTQLLMGEATWAYPGSRGLTGGLQRLQQVQQLWNSFGTRKTRFPTPTHCTPNTQEKPYYTSSIIVVGDTDSSSSSSSSSTGFDASSAPSSSDGGSNSTRSSGAAPLLAVVSGDSSPSLASRIASSPLYLALSIVCPILLLGVIIGLVLLVIRARSKNRQAYDLPVCQKV